jgi:hypothetical protein
MMKHASLKARALERVKRRSKFMLQLVLQCQSHWGKANQLSLISQPHSPDSRSHNVTRNLHIRLSRLPHSNRSRGSSSSSSRKNRNPARIRGKGAGTQLVARQSIKELKRSSR